MQLPLNKARFGVLVGAVGTAGALALVSAAGAGSGGDTTTFRPAAVESGHPEDVRGNCDESEHAHDAACTGAAAADRRDDHDRNDRDREDRVTTTTAAPGGALAAGAHSHTLATVGGSVTYSVDGADLRLASAMPAQGWRVEVEQASGREIEVDFRSGTRRVQVNVEIEDGQVRERVRIRDDAAGTDVRIENGVVVRNDAADVDNSGPGSASSGRDGTTVDDRGHDGAGHGADDTAPDDAGHGGSDDGSGSNRGPG
jgi:hypothetical protein